jgi:hypothetical protein
MVTTGPSRGAGTAGAASHALGIAVANGSVAAAPEPGSEGGL